MQTDDISEENYRRENIDRNPGIWKKDLNIVIIIIIIILAYSFNSPLLR